MTEEEKICDRKGVTEKMMDNYRVEVVIDLYR
jgi:hypothetical protein